MSLKITLTAAAAFVAVAALPVAPAQAAGCIKGALVGGVAGHYAGHHAVLGAVGGCLTGRHLAAEARRKREAAAAAAASGQPLPNAPAQ